MKKIISFVVPIYNESKNIALIYKALILELEKIKDFFDYEIIFVNDGSKDNSLEEIKELADIDPKVKLIDFSRNFGKEIALTAGLKASIGDLAIIIDADLQHPPKLIIEFIEKWQSGIEMVVGIRKKNRGSNIFRKVASFVFYNFIYLLGATEIEARSTDYRLLDRKVIDAFNKFSEHDRISRGLLDWLGFKKDYIYFEADLRVNGESAYCKTKLFNLALSSIISHSLFPLKLAGYLGMLIIFFSGPLGIFIFVDKYLFNNFTGYNFSGTAMLALLNMLLTGITLSCLGLISLYIGNIQNEVKNRPLYVVREKKNFDTK